MLSRAHKRARARLSIPQKFLNEIDQLGFHGLPTCGLLAEAFVGGLR
jgi:hypothetical protein